MFCVNRPVYFNNPVIAIPKWKSTIIKHLLTTNARIDDVVKTTRDVPLTVAYHVPQLIVYRWQRSVTGRQQYSGGTVRIAGDSGQFDDVDPRAYTDDDDVQSCSASLGRLLERPLHVA